MEQVNTAITQMRQVTRSNSSQTEAHITAAAHLAGQAERLLQLVETFQSWG